MSSSVTVREFALAQAALEHGVYFLELGADQRAAAYFRFAAEHLHGLSSQLLIADGTSPLKRQIAREQ
ncbi:MULTISPECIES: hypothetical protein [unclassified Leptolyngbya]|jgi:hypothetical protein|uniref:hypothetical protein n=1 Tax=unclassified Leptolyngbya TaxID=2650499 RepID=UPI0016881F50|nr:MULTISPECIES: hypothetical protein [unclassified Leptolyngbya]MBD1913022.1 hypothetical protein [Leptolyngbya sp. FACHB-8]MBD2154477.1 hypothetical protein [Leptolyngbya sp. FACHB-16]